MLRTATKHLALWTALLTALPSGMAAEAQLIGTVVDENGLVVTGALLSLNNESLVNPLIAFTDDSGRFVLPSVAPGTYELVTEKQGFYAFVERSFAVKEGTNEIEIVLNHRQEFEETVNVVYSAPAIDRHQVTEEKALTAQEIVDLPFTSTHDFRNALILMPGNIKDNQGRVHLNGGDENQAHYLLDGFNVTSPLSGILENQVPVDALRAIRLETSRYSAEYGKGSAGVMELETSQGDDQFRFSSTNFFPSFEYHDRLVLSNWTPRATFSGPIRKGRVWFFNATALQYDLNVVDELPSTANTNRNWHGSNLTRFQVNLTRRNILSGSFLINFTNSRHFGITPLDPVETSRDIHDRSYFFSIKESAYLSGGWVLEAGFGINSLSTRERSLGDSGYVISPGGRTGNYYKDTDGRVRRAQAMATVITPAFRGLGKHSLKFGVDVNSIHLRRFSQRRAYEVRREDGTLSRKVRFWGDPSIEMSSGEYSAFVSDRWFPVDQVFCEVGVRLDWDELLKERMVSPRMAFTWGPGARPNSKFSAGIGIHYDATNLDFLAREFDQVRSDTLYGIGGEIVKGPVVSRHVADRSNLKAPFYLNWSLGYEQELPGELYFRSHFNRRHGRDGWSYEPVHPDLPEGSSVNVLALNNSRRDSYHYLELTVNKTFLDKYPWLLSYARSRARSSAVIDFSLENPLFAQQAGGPLDWDSPNRLISWGNFPLPFIKKHTLTYFLEWHSGFPYSAVNDVLEIVGKPNGLRFPDYLSLNLHVERRFEFWRSQWAFRAGFNNITGHRNPAVVNNNVNSPDYQEFSGGQGRVFTGRIRFLGKQ